MGRRAKPPKKNAQAKRPLARKSPKDEGAKVRDLEQRLAEALKREAEALEQQTATAEILRVISSSPTDLQPVFDTIARNAVQLIGGFGSAVFQVRDGVVHLVAQQNFDEGGLLAAGQVYPRSLDSPGFLTRVLRDGVVHHMPDIDRETTVPQDVLRVPRALGTRSHLIVPMLREATAVGAIIVGRREVGGFSGTHIALLQTFADQAVIAIENARLLTQLERRNADLAEALGQQTATGEILRVIASSPTDVQPVFDSIVRSARQLCEAEFSLLFRFDGTLLHFVAHAGLPAGWLDSARRAWPGAPARDSVAGRSVLSGVVEQIADVRADPDYGATYKMEEALRSIVAVPMLREGSPIGAIVVARPEAGEFPDRQIDVLKTFADQAVIAIENVRLFTELQTSNRDLTTALDTQTATSDILRVISRSQTDVQPVFEAILASAVRLLGAYSGAVTRIEGDQIALAAMTSTDDAGDAVMMAFFPQSRESGGTHAQVIRDRAPLNIADAQTDSRLREAAHANARARGYRSQAVVQQHARQGEMWDKAVRYLRQAGSKAFMRAANREAANSFEQALDALRQLPRQSDTIAESLDIRFDLRTALTPLGEWTRMGSLLDEAEVLAEAAGDQRRLARALNYKVIQLVLSGNVATGLQAGLRALAIGEAQADMAIQVVANNYVGLAYRVQGEYREAVRHCEAAIGLVPEDQLHGRFGQAAIQGVFGRNHLATALGAVGRFDDAFGRIRESLDIAEEAGHDYSLLGPLVGLGTLKLDQGDFASALVPLERGLDLCRTREAPLPLPDFAWALGAAYHAIGRRAEGVTLMEDAARRVAERRVTWSWWAARVAALGWAYLVDGRRADAIRAAQEGLAAARHVGERGAEGHVLRLLGDIAAHPDYFEVESGEAHYRQALALAEPRGMRPLVAHCHLGLGKLSRRTGQREQAREHLTSARTMYREMGMTYWLEQAEAELGA